MFAAVIGLVIVAWRYTHLNAVLAFWAAYILTRPLGARSATSSPNRPTPVPWDWAPRRQVRSF